jgi:hypothetical protein
METIVASCIGHVYEEIAGSQTVSTAAISGISGIIETVRIPPSKRLI